MKRYVSVVLFGLLSASTMLAQPNLVKVRVRVILVDQELNQKPVPFFVVTLKSGTKALEVKTSLEGTAEAQLPPGRYTVSSQKSAEMGDRRFSWNFQVALSGVQQNLDLTNDNATVEESDVPVLPAKAGSNDLTEQFKRLKNTVVTVRSESGQGTGFFVDGKGLILTNEHVVGNSEYLAVQFDRTHKILAKLIAADAQKDVALLSVNMAAFPHAALAPLYRAGAGRTPVQEGERVFTIGSPLSLDKIITTGIVSKVEAHTIMSDININPGNSGGPLFNGAGQVIGLTTFGARGDAGPGVSGIVRIEEALALLEQNRAKATNTPPGTLLPVEPLTPYPSAGLTEALRVEKYDARPYYFTAGDFNIALSTPPLDYREQEEKRLLAEREHKKRNKKQLSPDEGGGDSDAPKEWEGEAGEHPAVFGIYVMPKAKEGFGSAFGRSLNPNAAAKLKFKTDFQAMKLFCGDKEVMPIHPGRVPVTVSVRNRAVKMEDSTYKGVYMYPPDAVNPDCAQVRLEIYSAKGGEPTVKNFDEKTVQHVWADFDAFRKVQAVGTKAAKVTTP
ncbi:MAG: hypothetical protein NVS9B13_00240 [Candidatus Acidiferrum sp.]